MDYGQDNGRVLMVYKNMRRKLDTSEMSPLMAQQYEEDAEALSADKFLKNNSVNPMLVGLVSRLCANYPKYEFQIAPRGGYARAPCYTVVAWQGNMKLGKVSFLRSMYVLENDRIRKKLKRNGSRKTSSMDTALDIFRREFKPPSEVENLEAAHDSIASRFQQARQGMGYKVKQFIPSVLLTQGFRTLKPESIDRLLKVLELEGVPETDREQYAQAYETGTAIKSVVHPKPVGLVVTVGGDGNYYTQKYNNRAFDGHLTALPVDSYAPKSLPDSLRGSVALLKLLEDDSFLTDVGYKLNNTSFFVRANYESIR